MEWLVAAGVLFSLLHGSVHGNYPSISRQGGKVVFRYPSDVQSERDLDVCGPYRACNVIRNRFWSPLLVERQCRCRLRNECSWRWESSADNYTMTLDNRSQFKFCSPVTHLPACPRDVPALTTDEVIEQPSNFTTQRKSHIKQLPPRNITALCNCKDPHYWELHNETRHEDTTKGSTQIDRSYACAKLSRCNTHDACGFVRTDYHSIYYTCSCPENHMCITREKTVHEAQELLYSGAAYRAFCIPT